MSSVPTFSSSNIDYSSFGTRLTFNELSKITKVTNKMGKFAELVDEFDKYSFIDNALKNYVNSENKDLDIKKDSYRWVEISTVIDLLSVENEEDLNEFVFSSSKSWGKTAMKDTFGSLLKTGFKNKDAIVKYFTDLQNTDPVKYAKYVDKLRKIHEKDTLKANRWIRYNAYDEFTKADVVIKDDKMRNEDLANMWMSKKKLIFDESQLTFLGEYYMNFAAPLAINTIADLSFSMISAVIEDPSNIEYGSITLKSSIRGVAYALASLVPSNGAKAFIVAMGNHVSELAVESLSNEKSRFYASIAVSTGATLGGLEAYGISSLFVLSTGATIPLVFICAVGTATLGYCIIKYLDNRGVFGAPDPDEEEYEGSDIGTYDRPTGEYFTTKHKNGIPEHFYQLVGSITGSTPHIEYYMAAGREYLGDDFGTHNPPTDDEIWWRNNWGRIAKRDNYCIFTGKDRNGVEIDINTIRRPIWFPDEEIMTEDQKTDARKRYNKALGFSEEEIW